ncbi:MAG TPA: neutral zinc metallopeptidase [Rubricoccaceae bacterium]|nr:neutral zinc metallopeptidase [Rubricoccaceae bacterium]
MRLGQSRRSGNIVDLRGRRGGAGVGLGLGTVVLLLVGALLGVDPNDLAQVAEGPAPPTEPAPTGTPQDEGGDFVAALLGSMEDTWRTTAPQANIRYEDPQLVLYDGIVQSACGTNTAATGPFYCPTDARIYLDLSFFRELERFGASGDFAVAYVIAHEFGHHIQNLEGTLGEVNRVQQQTDQRTANDLSVRTELQADCYAGVWGYSAAQRNLLEPGDVEEGLQAAASVGDDHLQQMAGQAVTPEAFTHGSSAQRERAFRTGFERGDPAACDTFRDLRR